MQYIPKQLFMLLLSAGLTGVLTLPSEAYYQQSNVYYSTPVYQTQGRYNNTYAGAVQQTRYINGRPVNNTSQQYRYVNGRPVNYPGTQFCLGTSCGGNTNFGLGVSFANPNGPVIYRSTPNYNRGYRRYVNRNYPRNIRRLNRFNRAQYGVGCRY